MDNNETLKPPGHKRNKSSLSKSLSLLSRATSRSDTADARVNSTYNPQRSPERSKDITMPRLSLERSRENDPQRLSMERSRESVISTAPAPLVSATSPPIGTGISGGQPSSIEASVKVFRAYEALRSGETGAITKVIQDAESGGDVGLQGTTVLHLAIQCADDSVIEQVLSTSRKNNINAHESKDGNTPLHIAAIMNRPSVISILLAQRGVDDSTTNYQGKTALDLAKTPEVFEKLQMAKSMFIDGGVKDCHRMVASKNYTALETLFSDDHFRNVVDINSAEMASDPSVTSSGGTLLHQAAIHRDQKLIELLLLNGADPFRRDRKGKLPQDVTEDKATRALLKKSPAAAAAQRGIQEKTILGSNAGQAARPQTGENALGGKEGREMKGYLKKWVNYTTGYKLRWFVLEDGVLSYYKHQDDAGSACRGAINMKIAQLHMDGTDNSRFEIIGNKSSVKYHLKANHEVEAKRWFWSLTNAMQHAKDQAKATAKSQNPQQDFLKNAGPTQATGKAPLSPVKSNNPAGAYDSPRASMDVMDRGAGPASYDGRPSGDDGARFSGATTAYDGEPDDDDYGDDASSIDAAPVTKDAFMIAAHSARLQLDMLSQMSVALQNERARSPTTPLSNPSVTQALSSYESSVANLRGLISDLGRIARDRESYWQYKLEQEVNVRRIWENNMLKVAKDHDELESKFGESEEKRKRTKRALRDALEHSGTPASSAATALAEPEADEGPGFLTPRARTMSLRRKSTFAEMEAIAGSESEDEDDDEFFDAVTAGEVEVANELPPQASSQMSPEQPPQPPVVVAHEAVHEPVPAPVPAQGQAPVAQQHAPAAHKAGDMSTAFKGYEDGPRTKLTLAADDRPKVSLWGILKSMIGKDMSKMTLPVSFNEPTSLLQRVAEDMEYVDLLDTAASRSESTERMVYVAAFAASEYASTIGRVAKPFNPLLGETYEYARPDKGYRFMIEQVSHHPPIGAAWANAKAWDYYGESAVRSKFYGKSFDINPLGTWFLRLRPTDGSPSELYTWKKVTSSVIGIITGSPTVDNYGAMEITNHTTGDVCTLDFKQRGWSAKSAYSVSGKVLSGSDGGKPRWSIGGKWNEKIYARLTPGYVDELEASGKQAKDANPNKAFLVWEASPRNSATPFNLTAFGVTLNALQPRLKPVLPPTDTRLRPDQRCMEDGEYDRAATEKNRLEEKQRATRRDRERAGEEWKPRWFEKAVDRTTGEEYWKIRREGGDDGEVEYWARRGEGDWKGCEDIF